MKLYLTLKHRFYKEKNSNDFEFYEILLYILQNGAIYLFKQFVLHTTLIPQNDIFLYYRPDQRQPKMCSYGIQVRNKREKSQHNYFSSSSMKESTY